jgi:hypothetical protein
LRLTPKGAAGALAFAKARGDDVVFCGHTHQAFHASEGGTRYFNTGSWTHERLTYAAVDEKGPRLGEFVPAPREPEIRDEINDEQQADASGEPIAPVC